MVVWEADGSPYGGLGYGHAIRRRLAAAGIATTTVPLPRRAPSAEEQAAPVHVLSGGATAVTSPVPWVQAARRALEPVLLRALAGEATVTGICFGAQLIAATLAGPGAVGPNPRGLEAGLAVVHPPGSVPGRAAPAGTVVAQIHYHHVDPVAVRDVGGEVVLSNRHTAVQAYTMGPTVTGLQFHPELDPSATRATMRAHQDLLGAFGVGLPEVLSSVDLLAGGWHAGTFDRFVTRPARERERAPVLAGG